MKKINTQGFIEIKNFSVKHMNENMSLYGMITNLVN